MHLVVHSNKGRGVHDARSRHNRHNSLHNWMGNIWDWMVDQGGGHDMLHNGCMDHVAAGIGHGVMGNYWGDDRVMDDWGTDHSHSRSGGGSSDGQKASESDLGD